MTDKPPSLPIAHCPDCGPVPVSHALERWSTRFDEAIQVIAAPIRFVWEWIKPAVAAIRPGRAAPFFLETCAKLHLGKILDHPDAKLISRALVLWEEADRRGIKMQEFRPFGLARDIYFAKYRGDTRLFDGLPRPRASRGSSLEWMDDKGIILKKFRGAGIPVPRGGACTTLAQAEKIFAAIASDGGSVIVKPSIGSRSRHTYLHIKDAATLRNAFFKAKEISSRAVVEEELPGFVFRATLVGGKIAGVMRREPAHVTGDGRSTVRELVERENKNPARRGPVFHEIPFGKETDMQLARQGLTLDSIPAKGSLAFLGASVSRAAGGSTTEMTDVHPENKKLFLRIAEVLNDPLVGVDFMIKDMASPWQDQKCGVIECNSLPFIDLHHFPLKGPVRNVAGMVWDLIFPAIPQREQPMSPRSSEILRVGVQNRLP